MSVDLIISRVSNAKAISDKLVNDEVGINHGEVTNNVETLEEIFYIRHNGTAEITNLKVYLDGLSELLEWSGANSGDGLLLDANNDEVFETNFITGVGDSLANAIVLGDLNVAEEKIIRIKIKVPGNEDTEGVRKFNLNFDFDYTV